MKKRILSILLFAGCVLGASAEVSVPGAEDVVSIWPEDRMPGRGANAVETIHSPERTDSIRIANISQPTLSLFPAKGDGEPVPMVIVCPGGGYRYVVVDKEGAEIARWLNSLGISAAVLKYRVPDNRAGALQDIQRAIRIARANSKDWNIDPIRVGVIGFSAGGNLCAKASSHFDSKTYVPIDAVDKQDCRPDFNVLVYPAYLERGGKIATDLNLKADIPPTLLVHCEDDTTYVPSSKVYAEALKAGNHPYKLLLYPAGGHGHGLRSEDAVRAWPKDAEKWFRESGILPVCDPVKIVLVGDSTMCDYDSKLPDRGWGMFVEEAFTPGSVEVDNLARKGRSTKTFIEEKLWDKALALKPDYVFIQFGHNDSHAPDRRESTDSATDYRDYLRRYIDDCRAVNATPILVTPMVRRAFHADGTMDDNLAPYAAAMKDVATEKDVSLIDLHSASWTFFESLGPDESQRYARNSEDRTHFNEKGARVILGLVMQELPEADLHLAKRLNEE